ncbi:hypothetical protein M5689_006274 [Euphorbia peplus]|nr:hypothetical protein M5689_006274 [Euphorbia peplus]
MFSLLKSFTRCGDPPFIALGKQNIAATGVIWSRMDWRRISCVFIWGGVVAVFFVLESSRVNLASNWPLPVIFGVRSLLHSDVIGLGPVTRNFRL